MDQPSHHEQQAAGLVAHLQPQQATDQAHAAHADGHGHRHRDCLQPVKTTNEHHRTQDAAQDALPAQFNGASVVAGEYSRYREGGVIAVGQATDAAKGIDQAGGQGQPQLGVAQQGPPGDPGHRRL